MLDTYFNSRRSVFPSGTSYVEEAQSNRNYRRHRHIGQVEPRRNTNYPARLKGG